MAFSKKNSIRLPPEVNRILLIKNLPFKISTDEMYDIFGKYGAIRQIRVGNTPTTKGTAFVVYEDIFEAKAACERLNGFNVCNRFLIVLYYQPHRKYKNVDLQAQAANNEKLKEQYNLNTPKQ